MISNYKEKKWKNFNDLMKFAWDLKLYNLLRFSWENALCAFLLK